MIGLLDTQVLMWADSDPSKLSANAVAFLQTPGNDHWVSVASLWEMMIKSQSGKLTLRAPLATIIADQRAANRIPGGNASRSRARAAATRAQGPV